VSDRRGFTLIELLIVVVVIGLLAALAVPKYRETKRVAYVAEMKQALRKTALDMELRFADRGSYSTCPPMAACAASLPDEEMGEGLSVTVTQASATGWRARALHGSAPGAECQAGAGALTPSGLEEGVPGGPSCK
jgi:prepilin-type N-terminal cleavage/methylation domain-containing protein